MHSAMFEESDSPKLSFDHCSRRERSPFSPSGEKVADRPDEGDFLRRQRAKTAPSPRPSPPIFATTLPCDATQHPQKMGERGKYAAVQINSILLSVLDPQPFVITRMPCGRGSDQPRTAHMAGYF